MVAEFFISCVVEINVEMSLEATTNFFILFKRDSVVFLFFFIKFHPKIQ